MDSNQLGWPVSAFVRDALGGAISRAQLYELWKKGEGPKRTRIGRRVLITHKDAMEWLQSFREKEER